MIKAILFDLDDTLYDEMQFVEGGFKAVSRYISENFCVDEKEFFKTLTRILQRDGRGHVFDIALKDAGLFKKSLVINLIQIYRNHTPSLTLYPDAQYILARLQGKYKLGLITDGNQRVQRSKIHALGIQGFFNVVITTNCYGRTKQKPSPFPYLKAISRLGVSPDETVYVGDNPYKDFIGARKTGMLTTRLLRGQYVKVRLCKEFEADNMINDLNELLVLHSIKVYQ